MFSSRLGASAEVNRITRRLAALRESGAPILDLTESNPTRAGIEYPADDIASLLADPRALSYQPEPAGHPAAREAVARYYAERGARVPLDRILLTASTSEAYAYLFKLLADPGDEVLVPRPSYPLFEFLATLECVRAVQYPLAYHGAWEIDFSALHRAITPRTRAIVLVNPNNPTGSLIGSDELPQLIALCRDHGLAIISDEVFSDYTLASRPNSVRSLVNLDDVLTFSMSGLSKVVGLPQMKLGWIVVSGPDRLRREAVQRLEFIADIWLSVSTPVQLAAPGLLALRTNIQAQICARLRRNLAAFDERPLFVEAGWYAVLRVPRIRTEEEWVLELLDKGVLVQPGFFYDFETEAFLVLSLLTPETVFAEGVHRIQSA